MNSEFDWLYSRFPKKRLVLPEAYKSLYEKEYKRNRGIFNSSINLKKKIESWMHNQVAIEKNLKGAILEIGAGSLNHVNYECKNYKYDIIEPFTALYKGQQACSRIRKIYKNIKDIPLKNRYSKIISIAVLEHIEDLPGLISRSILLLEKDGVMVHAIPSEGGFFWYLGWRFVTGISFRIRTGLSYAPLMRYEHVNNANEIISILNIFFDDVSYKRFPFPFLHGSFYTCITLRKPNKMKAELYLKGGM